MIARRLALLASLASALSPTRASARATTELGYRVDETLSTVLRFVRVDRGCKVTDKDADAAYVTFECPKEDGKVNRGAIEIIRSTTQGREGVRIQVSLPDEPHGMELRFVELLERKLRDERGTPREAPKPTPPAAAPDAGTKPGAP